MARSDRGKLYQRSGGAACRATEPTPPGYASRPARHTEHCVFCRFLSAGTSYKDCGHPCEQHRVALRDTNGCAHPVMADVGCRNTVFGAEAQEASRHMDEWREVGIRHIHFHEEHEPALRAWLAQAGAIAR